MGRVAFVPQTAFIINGTLKDNVLFGHPFEPELYARTIHACCLQSDIDLLPAGDGTEIGSGGINLSGGQRQRVSLARALYSQVRHPHPMSSYMYTHPIDQPVRGALLAGETPIKRTPCVIENPISPFERQIRAKSWFNPQQFLAQFTR